MDIEKIKRKRVKSVQDQNAITKSAIANIAKWWKSGNKLPKPIEELAAKSNINRSTAILVDESSGPICCEHSYSGCFLTNDGDFWSYEVDLNDKETEIVHIEKWGIIDVEANPHMKGIGKSWGYLCTQLLNETKKQNDKPWLEIDEDMYEVIVGNRQGFTELSKQIKHAIDSNVSEVSIETDGIAIEKIIITDPATYASGFHESKEDLKDKFIAAFLLIWFLVLPIVAIGFLISTFLL